MQSHNFVPGVSGWRLDASTGELEVNEGGVTRFRASGLEPVEQPVPFITCNGQIYINKGLVEKGQLKGIADKAMFALSLQTDPQGRPYVAGVGLGLDTSYAKTKDETFAGSSIGEILCSLAEQISRTELGASLKREFFEERVKEILRKELGPGGLIRRP